MLLYSGNLYLNFSLRPAYFNSIRLYSGNRMFEMQGEVVAGGIRVPLSGRGIRRDVSVRAVLTNDRSLQPAVFVGCAEVKKKVQFLE